MSIFHKEVIGNKIQIQMKLPTDHEIFVLVLKIKIKSGSAFS